ncbi:neuropilin and tolloid-like protein 1 [Galleria mellonella]|uniref:Neuropilin and tolloid-like protein 1 n=1 Tax=Galleria mellonella TaxID=7137 RepID=A0ABM3N7L2_GALME|nr:neuropilin and tolloid-like protein 1 [Galleria mellonella]
MTSPALIMLSLALVCSTIDTATEQTAAHDSNQRVHFIDNQLDNINATLNKNRTNLNNNKVKSKTKILEDDIYTSNDDIIKNFEMHKINVRRFNQEMATEQYGPHKEIPVKRDRYNKEVPVKREAPGKRYTNIYHEGIPRNRVKRSQDSHCEAFEYHGRDQRQIRHPYQKDDTNNTNYYSNVHCVTVINGTESSVIELTFVDIFHIEYHPDCAYDYLEIRDGSKGYSALLGKLCGHQFPRQIRTTGPYAWLKFHSDDTIEYEGFHINIAILNGYNSHRIPDKCYETLEGMYGDINSAKIDSACTTGSMGQALDILWTIKSPANTRIFLNFTTFILAKPNECEENVIQVFGSVLEYDAKLAHYCGSMANSVQTKGRDSKGVGDDGNLMYVRLYASKAAKAGTNFSATYTAFRTLDPNKDDKCNDTQFDCEDNTCIEKVLTCNGYANCRLKTDEDNTGANEHTETTSMLSQTHILVILVIFSLILSGMSFVFLFKCIRKLYQDHKIIKEHIRQSCEDRLDSLVSRRLTLDAQRLQRDSESRPSLERDNHTNEMFKQQRSFSKHKDSIDSDFIQETHLDVDSEPWRREVDRVPIEVEDIRIERNGRTRRSDISKREESIKSKSRESKEREKKEIRDVSVGAPDTKESSCQTRESLFQTDAPPSSEGSGSNSRGFSTFGYSGATIVRPSPPATINTSEVTIELLSQVPQHQDSVKQKKIPDRRPMSTETTRSAPDVIIVSKPIG